MTKRFDLDEILQDAGGKVEPLASVKISVDGVKQEFNFYNPRHITEGDRLRFIDAQADLFEIYQQIMELQKQYEAIVAELPKERDDDYQQPVDVQNRIVNLNWEQQRLDIRSIIPSRDYLSALTKSDIEREAIAHKLTAYQITGLMKLVQDVVNGTDKEESDDNGDAEKKNTSQESTETVLMSTSSTS